MPLAPLPGSLPFKRLAAELLVIVAGVLIALAADAWWERRIENSEARNYLEQLLVDLEETEAQLGYAITSDSARMVVVQDILARAYSGEYPEQDSLGNLTGYHEFQPVTGTLTALVEGGDVRLIRNDSLRFELIRTFARIESSEQMLRHMEELSWNSTERVATGFARHSLSASGWGRLQVAGAFRDPDIMGALQVQVIASSVRTTFLRRIQGQVQDIIEQLQHELAQ